MNAKTLKSVENDPEVTGMAIVFALSSAPRRDQMVEFRENPFTGRDDHRRFSVVVWLGMNANDRVEEAMKTQEAEEKRQ